MTWTDADFRDFKAQERRDWRATQRESAKRDEEWRRTRMTATRKTSQGERVERFPDVEDLRERIGGVREALADAFDRADAERNLRSRIAETRSSVRAGFRETGGERR